MRLLLEDPDPRSLDELAASAEAARRAGIDGVLLRSWPALPASLVTAAAVAARVDEVLVAAEVEVGGRHPVEIAEEAAVVDCASGGRLVLVARPAPSADPEAYAESLDVLRLAFGAAPFRFEGAHWRVPANLPANVHQVEDLVRVTPAPAQVRLPVWGSGTGWDATAPRALGFLADAGTDDDTLGAAWAAAAGPASVGAPRGRREEWVDAPTLAGRLRAGRAGFGQDWAAVRAPAHVADTIGTQVRPRVQLDRLTSGLEEFWDEQRPWEHRGRR
jgi:alkanesulfonate monooxygenase SsuD/methylene tetrahydromethanopterin reductase-like flavin-dependent oxidoreductase (luciferase family)